MYVCINVMYVCMYPLQDVPSCFRKAMHEFASANDSLFMGASIFQSLGRDGWSLCVNGIWLGLDTTEFHRDIIPYTVYMPWIFNSKVRFACADPGRLMVIEGEIDIYIYSILFINIYIYYIILYYIILY